MLLEKLSNVPIHIDKLSKVIGKSTAETLSALLPLEFKDLVKQLPGKLFVRVELSFYWKENNSCHLFKID